MKNPIMLRPQTMSLIEEELARVQNQARGRMISAAAIVDALRVVDERFWMLTPAEKIGMRVTVDLNAGTRTAGYNREAPAMVSTQFTAKRVAGGWKITDISRQPVLDADEAFQVELPAEKWAAALAGLKKFPYPDDD